jgi:hypothetical protein
VNRSITGVYGDTLQFKVRELSERLERDFDAVSRARSNSTVCAARTHATAGQDDAEEVQRIGREIFKSVSGAFGGRTATDHRFGSRELLT